MGVGFEGKEERSSNNLSIHPAVCERVAPEPGGRGILMGLSKRLCRLPEMQGSDALTPASSASPVTH